jgi:hypothetical protein
VKEYREGSIDVSYCLDHTGHRLDVALLRLSEAELELLHHYISSKRDIRWIMNDLTGIIKV